MIADDRHVKTDFRKIFIFSHEKNNAIFKTETLLADTMGISPERFTYAIEFSKVRLLL